MTSFKERKKERKCSAKFARKQKVHTGTQTQLLMPSVCVSNCYTIKWSESISINGINSSSGSFNYLKDVREEELQSVSQSVNERKMVGQSEEEDDDDVDVDDATTTNSEKEGL